MTFYTFLESGEPALYSYERLYALLSHGLFTLESLIYKGILRDVYFDYVGFNGLAFERGRKEEGSHVYIANFYNSIDKRFDIGKTEEFVALLKRFIRGNKIWYPYFDTATLTINIMWVGTVMGERWTGYLSIRNSRSFDSPKRYGDIKIDLLSPAESRSEGEEDIDLSTFLMGHLENETGLTERDFIDLFEYLIHPERYGVEPSEYHAYKRVKYSMFSISSEPLKRLDRSYAMAISNIKSLPKLISHLLNVISSSNSGLLKTESPYSKHKYLIDSLRRVFKTINPILLSGKLSRSEVRDLIVENAIKMNVREIVPSSIIVADRDMLSKFVIATLTAYDSYLNELYEEVERLWDKLSKWLE